ncbi:MAG TPA: hypothetical protein QF720_03355 [Nitrospinota bacterium]|nr:hypothetical protein [Nitrospinota bacterium]|tara:strand:+ start:51457 stop:52437 length:981 start_codon:yes stop_codon:yes gene_type:complete
MNDRKRFRKPSSNNIKSRRRKCVNGFTYPFGAYPEKDFANKTGYDSKYIRDENYFYYQIAVSHEQILPTMGELFNIMPEQGFVVAQLHTDDHYQENDTHISSEATNLNSVKRWIYEWKDVVLDDGFFGIGVFFEEPIVEVFLDEHKTIHVYHTNPELMEDLLEHLGIPFVFDLQMYWDQPHYHKSIPLLNDYSKDYLTAFEELADRYDLLYDVEVSENSSVVDKQVGIICWKVDVRGYGIDESQSYSSNGFYSTIYVNAVSRNNVVEQIEYYLDSKGERADLFLQAARIPYKFLPVELKNKNNNPGIPGVWSESERAEFDWDHPSY